MMATAERHDRQVWETFWDQQKPIDEVYANSERIIAQITKLGPVRGKRILEVGAGSGRDGLQLAEQGGRIIFLDYAVNSLRTIARLAQSEGRSVSLVRGDAFHLPLKSSCIDVVFHQGLLEHFTQPLTLVKENQRVLKSNGYAIADVPHRYHLYTVVKHVLIALNRWFAGWETEFSRRQLERLFCEAGLKPVSFYGDWMRPSFGYRALREGLKKIGVRLPMQPKSIPLLGSLRKRCADRFRQTRLAQWTFMDIGVIGMK